MRLKIENAIVRRNIEIFKIILRRATKENPLQRQEKSLFVYQAFVHRIRGEILLSDLAPPSYDPKEWKAIVFKFTPPVDSLDSFDCHVEGEAGTLAVQELNDQAQQVLKETLKTIRFISRFLPKIKNLSSVLQEFSHVNLDSFLERVASGDVIHEAWHQIDRIACEMILQDQPAGTFLFRKDEYASILEKGLTIAHQYPIQCITLSFIDFQKRVHDLTIVRKRDGWLFYDDDPTLEGIFYPTAHLLIDSMKGALKMPLLHGNGLKKDGEL